MYFQLTHFFRNVWTCTGYTLPTCTFVSWTTADNHGGTLRCLFYDSNGSVQLPINTNDNYQRPASVSRFTPDQTTSLISVHRITVTTIFLHRYANHLQETAKFNFVLTPSCPAKGLGMVPYRPIPSEKSREVSTFITHVIPHGSHLCRSLAIIWYTGLQSSSLRQHKWRRKGMGHRQVNMVERTLICRSDIYAPATAFIETDVISFNWPQ